MRRTLAIALTLAMSLPRLASLGWGCPWGGDYWGGARDGRWGGAYGDMGSAPSGDHQKFLDETADLRKDLAAKGAEYDALMARPDPDPTRAGELSKEIFDIQAQLREKARQYEISGMRHRGSHNHGRHHRGAWNCGAYCW